MKAKTWQVSAGFGTKAANLIDFYSSSSLSSSSAYFSKFEFDFSNLMFWS